MKKHPSTSTVDINEIPIEKIALTFTDPDTGQEIIVPVCEVVEGGMDYATINAHPYVYAKEHGYISIMTEDSVMMQRLDLTQVEIIDFVLSKKQELEVQQQLSDEIENPSTTFKK